MKSSRRRVAYAISPQQVKKKIQTEASQSIRFVLLIGFFFFCLHIIFSRFNYFCIWIIVGFIILSSPCVFICLMEIIIEKTLVSKLLENIFILLAKSSVAWFGLMILFGEKEFRSKLTIKKAKYGDVEIINKKIQKINKKLINNAIKKSTITYINWHFYYKNWLFN